MCKKRTGKPRVVPKKKKVGKIQIWSQKEVVDKGRLFVQQYFQISMTY